MSSLSSSMLSSLSVKSVGEGSLVGGFFVMVFSFTSWALASAWLNMTPSLKICTVPCNAQTTIMKRQKHCLQIANNNSRIWPRPTLDVAPRRVQPGRMKPGYLPVNSTPAYISNNWLEIKANTSSHAQWWEAVTWSLTQGVLQALIRWTDKQQGPSQSRTWMDGSFRCSYAVHLVVSVPIACRNST